MKSDKNAQSINMFITTQPSVLWGILVTITLFSTIVLYPDRGKVNYDYALGDIAERDIKAPRDFFVEDKDATLLNRQQVADSFKTIYDYDPTISSKLSERIDQAFAIPLKLFGIENETNPPTLEMVMNTLEDFENMLGITVEEKFYSTLYKYKFNKDIINTIKIILAEILNKGVITNKDILLKDEKKGIILKNIELSKEGKPKEGKPKEEASKEQIVESKEQIVESKEQIVENLKGLYSHDEAQTMVKTVGEPLFKGMQRNVRNMIVEICRQLIIPNITINKIETEKRIAKAQSKIKPVLYQIKHGEMILREGERVDENKLFKLKTLSSQLQEKNIVMTQVGTALMILFSLLVIYFVLLKNHKKIDKHHNKNILFLSIMLIIFLSITKISAPIVDGTTMNLPLDGTLNMNLPFDIASESIFLVLPLAAGAMTVSLFLGFEISLYFTLILSILGAIIFFSRIEVFIFFLLSSITGAFWIKECRERKIFIITGFKLALFNAGLAIALSIYASDLEIISIAKNIMLAGLGGLTAGIITAGLTPVAEIIFSYTTEIKFLELSNLDQPIIKRLMIEAPGTYNHSIIVANLAEAAASAIGVSALKTKVGAFYHDIGKLDKPLYFIENQTDGKNRHDKISPSMSALVLIQHTKKGVEFAKEYKLGQEIMDTIQQHHGTSLIKYFYNKSVKIHGADAVKESDFRYPGPKPQTREAAIVMLADVVEAALRTLERPTSARIQGRVQELINAIFLDGQLEECELTLKDLHQIAGSFNKILTGLYHQRIEYTAEKPEEPKKEQKVQENRVLVKYHFKISDVNNSKLKSELDSEIKLPQSVD